MTDRAGRPHVIAVIGSGAFAAEHLLALRNDERVRVAYVVGHDHRRATELAALVPGALGVTDGGLALADPAVDAVDICNATPDHAPWAVRAAEAGKHVHVEKPVCRNLLELDGIERAVAAAGVSLMVGQTVRFQPAVAAVKQQIDRGAIGTARLLHLSWYTAHVWPDGWRSWQLDPEQSGGHPVHNGVHAIDAAIHLLGRAPTRVFCRPLRTWASSMPTPDSFQMTVRFGADALATIELCYALRTPGAALRRLMIAGSTGTLLHDTEGETELHPLGPLAPPASIAGALGLQLRHWVDTLEGAEPIVRLDEVRAALATAVSAQQSLLSGDAVEVAADLLPRRVQHGADR